MAPWQQHYCCTAGQCSSCTVLHVDTITYIVTSLVVCGLLSLTWKQGKFSQMHVSRVLWCTVIYHVGCRRTLVVKPSLGRVSPGGLRQKRTMSALWRVELVGSYRERGDPGYPLNFFPLCNYCLTLYITCSQQPTNRSADNYPQVLLTFHNSIPNSST